MGYPAQAASIASKPTLTIDFVVIGGGIAGLCCAYALTRIGHRVVVLEQDNGLDQTKVSGGCRLPPNMSKILFHWGLEQKVRDIAVTSGATFLKIYETGYMLGTHEWDEEVLRETGGEFVFCHHVDLRRMMRELAEKAGATIRYNTKVSFVDPESRSVRLSTGETVYGDVLIGADGPRGLCRRVVTGSSDLGPRTGLSLYSAMVSGERMRQDPELAYFLQQKHYTQAVWFGNGMCSISYPVVTTDKNFAMMIWAPDEDGDDATWGEQAPAGRIQNFMGTCEPRLRKLAKIAPPPSRLPVYDVPDLEDWVHDDGPLLLVGEAAHTLLPGSIQGSSMALEDAAVLAKLFSHLRSEDQIESFLYAFQDLRQKRCATVRAQEMANLHFMTMPPCAMQEARDRGMRAKYDAGLNVLTASDGETSATWEEIKELFGYDAEDEADNWWVEWGLLRERAKERTMDFEMNIQVAEMVIN
ncbi:hypothetical protein JAAARDRAFT_127959 [Jaapia argillacea MUCL 33604]|uniref:FAD-binding domain-containing protein n=1 Tax=Jaapia argillacea MUCL 33604 TaxID=933084 RepID=A0A067PYQ8_9AGAM|nr:hypothetical protein JAAARDRAFT_127959 [Jaapia argillacea MUCL 33604]